MAAEAGRAGPVLGAPGADAGGLERVPAVLAAGGAEPAIRLLRPPETLRAANLQEVGNEPPRVDGWRSVVAEQHQPE